MQEKAAWLNLDAHAKFSLLAWRDDFVAPQKVFQRACVRFMAN